LLGRGAFECVPEVIAPSAAAPFLGGVVTAQAGGRPDGRRAMLEGGGSERALPAARAPSASELRRS
jgi:hypothetical protein